MLKRQVFVSFIRRQPYWKLAIAAAALVLLLILWGTARHGDSADGAATFAARRGPLEITVLEGGSLHAIESQEVKCQVRVGHQGAKILKIVEEGYQVTEDDVKNRKVLVELDSSELEQQIVQQEIQYQSALASLIDAEQAYQIQLRQNSSDILAAEQKMRFARMDFEKFLGDGITGKVIADCGLEALIAAAMTNRIEELDDLPPRGPDGRAPSVTNGAAPVAPAVLVAASDAKPAPDAAPGPAERQDSDRPDAELKKIDFARYADIQLLGDGEAKQKLRKFGDDLQVSKKELGQATTTIEGTRRLFEKGFVTRNELQRDEIAFDSSRLKVQTAETARDLFMKYDFIKLAEESLSKFADSVRDLDKARRVAVSKQAQARARLRSTQGQHTVQSRQRKELQQQLANCVIVAEKTGLVVYGGGRDEGYGGEERVREGATVRERQSIITIPDMTKMSVSVKVHESYIKKIQKGQKARITVDAYPDKVLTGEVSKVAVLPDSQNRWMNPDMKIYNTTVTIDGTHEWAKPGLSAKVSIMVSEIPDCIYVPIQAVSAAGDKQVCYVARRTGTETRPVTIGDFNDDFIEIRSGIKEGEMVCLRPPAGAESESSSPKEPKPSGKDKPANGLDASGKAVAAKS